MKLSPSPGHSLLVTFLFLTAASSAFSLNSPVEDDSPNEPAPPSWTVEEDLVVSAERWPVPEGEVGSSVTLIAREEIEARHETTVLELLRTVPGVAVVQSGGPGRGASIFLRGANSQHTLVLLDGLRVNSVQNGGFDFADLTTDNVERIEILRGPQSTLYGSEALGGVISITTRRGEGEAEWSVDGRAGELETRWLAVGARGRRGSFDWSATASGFETAGISTASERLGNREVDPYQNRTASGRLGWGYGDGRADLTLRLTDGETGLDGFAFGVGPVDDPNFVQFRDFGQIALSLDHQFTPRWRGKATLGTVRDETEGEDPDTPFNNFRFEDRLDQLILQSDLELNAAGDLTAGYELERRHAESPGSFDESATLSSLFLNHRWSWNDRLHLSAGARYDDYQDVGSDATWRVTGSYLTGGERVRLHGSYGTGFRAPSFVELFFPGAGNLELDPETSQGGDFGVESFFASRRVRVDVTWFRNRFDDLIVFDFTTFTFANVAEADSEGLETVVEVRPWRDFELAAFWTSTDTENRGTGEPLARRPRDRGTLQALYTPPNGWTVAASLLRVADRVEFDGRPMDDYERLDVSLEAPGWGAWAPYLRIDNVLDEEYEEAPGFTTPGRVAVVGARATF